MTTHPHRTDRPADRPAERRRGRAAVLEVVTRRYLAGERVDMSEVAAELGIARATLYRRAGNHDEVLAAVLAEQTERLFRHTLSANDSRQGVQRVIGVLDAFMRSVLDSVPLKALTGRDPAGFLRLATMPGAIETRSTELLLEVMLEEIASGQLRPALPAPVLAQAIVRVCDAFMYRHLLGAGAPDLEAALEVVTLMLRPAHGSDHGSDHGSGHGSDHGQR